MTLSNRDAAMPQGLAGSMDATGLRHQAAVGAHVAGAVAFDPLDLARDQAITNIVGSRAAISINGRAEEALGAELVHDRAVEALMPETVQHARHQPVLRVGARGIAQHLGQCGGQHHAFGVAGAGRALVRFVGSDRGWHSFALRSGGRFSGPVRFGPFQKRG
mgnify:CR=1 FL=1